MFCPDAARNSADTSNMSPAFGPFGNMHCIPFSQINLVTEMRYHWLQLVIWSRSYMCCRASRQGALPVIYERLYSVPEGFYKYISPFYGQVIAEQLIDLLSQYVIIFASLIDAMAAGNQQEANMSQSAWYKNANDIAALLVQINNSWNYNEWQDLLGRLIRMNIDQAIAVLSGNYQGEIVIYDRLQYHSLIMADYMSRGVLQSLTGNPESRNAAFYPIAL